VNGDSFKGIPLVKPRRGNVQATVEVCGAAMRPLPDNKIDFKFLSNFDPKVKAIPYNALNWFSRKFAKGLFKKI
jgi:hypothetical protein